MLTSSNSLQHKTLCTGSLICLFAVCWQSDHISDVLASRRESCPRSPSWHTKLSTDLCRVPRPFHTRRRPTQSSIYHCVLSTPIAWQCLSADCQLLVAELFRSPDRRHGRRISRITDHILLLPQDTPVHEVFFWLLAGHQMTVSGGPSSSSAT